jgi:phospholipase C
MLNADIFGYEERIDSELRGERVHVKKYQTRASKDAAVPPGQSVELEFFVAELPFSFFTVALSDGNSTTERSAGTSTGTTRGSAAAGALAASTATTRVASSRATSRVSTTRGSTTRARSTAAAAVRSTSVAAAAAIAANPSPVTAGTTVMARIRSPLGSGLDISGGLILEPFPPDFPPPQPMDHVLPYEFTLTPPNGLEPIVLTNPKFNEVNPFPAVGSARLSPDFIRRAIGKWKLSVKNINPVAKRIQVHVYATHAITAARRKDIPLSLLNNLSSVALQRASPTIGYQNGNVVVSTPSSFLDLMGVDRVFSLGSFVGSIIADLPTYTPLAAQIMSRSDFIASVQRRITNLVAEFKVQARSGSLGANAVNARQVKAIKACQKSLELLQRHNDQSAAYCLVLEGMFTDSNIDLRYVGTVARIDNQMPQIGLLFNEHMQFTDVVSNLAIDLSPLLVKVALATAAGAVLLTAALGPLGGLAAVIGGIKLFNSVNIDAEEKIRQQIRDRGALIAEYVKRTFERITDFGAFAKHARILPRAAADRSDVLRVTYFNPSEAHPPRPMRPFDDLVGTLGAEVLELASGDVPARAPRALSNAGTATSSTTTRGRAREGVAAASAAAVSRSTSAASSAVRSHASSIVGSVLAARDAGLAAEVAPSIILPLSAERPGAPPADFVVPAPETLARLDDHACIVLLMMENRSYDHYFHDLGDAHPGRDYAKPPADYSNVAPPGFKEPFRPAKNTDIKIGKNLVFFPGNRSSDPGHNYTHTQFQIGGGTEETIGSGEMRGFAADFARQSDSPHIAMSYFGMDDLPVYKALANHYPVCDRWFASLPVGTYPNRLSALQGNVPFLFNPHMDDPSLGYLEDYSIFDLFDSQGISWKFFESDLGTLRLYDRYRLNVSNVRPIAELDRNLRAIARGAPMPRAMFIEPLFLFGNDDHPPMSVADGQTFIQQVVGKFIEHGLLDRALFIITYDEHGGFFDHVAPPGSPAALARERPGGVTAVGPQPYGAVESLFPQDPAQAPTSLGVRVPSMVLSKWTSARANHTVLDHTAILKTLLLHNRARVSTEQFGRFGERVKKRAHLGQVLDRAQPRAIDYAALSSQIGYRRRVSLGRSAGSVFSGRDFGITPVHPASVVRGIALPRPRKILSR